MDEVQNKKGEVRHDEVSLKELILKIQDLFKYLLSKWYVFIFAAFLGGGLGYWYAYMQKPIYIATTSFVLEAGEQSGGGLGQVAGMAAMMGIDIGGGSGGIFQGDNLLNLYRSRKMIEATLLLPSKDDKSKLLIDHYLEMTKMKESWQNNNPDLLQINFSKEISVNLQRSRDSILQKIVLNINKSHLEVGKIDKKSAIIKVDVNAPDEIFSKEFNEALVDQVNAFYVKSRTKKSLDNISILQHKTDSVRAVMNGSISAAASVFDATPNLNPTRQAQRTVPTQRSQFSAETNKAILGQLVQNLELSKLNLMKEAPLIQKIDEPVYPLEVKLIGKLKAIIVGAILLSFFMMCVLLVRRLYIQIINN